MRRNLAVSLTFCSISVFESFFVVSGLAMFLKTDMFG